MKFRLLFFLVPILLPAMGLSQGGEAKLRIMTYNIWFDNPENTGHAWADRKEGVLATLKRLKPDILCVQEALSHQVLDLEAAGYAYFGVGRDDGHKSGEFSAIFYRLNHFEILDGATFWLSEYPDSVGSVGWDAILPRIASWVRLRELGSGKEFHVLNTHFSHVGEKARLESVRLIMDRVFRISGEGPWVVTGDFNFTAGTEPYDLMTRSGGPMVLYDARSRAGQPRHDPGYSFVGSGLEGEPGHIIDHIFVSGQMEVREAGIWPNCADGRCPSDHLPVVADIAL